MNDDEKEAAKHILKMCVNTAKFARHYLELMRGAKLRVEIDKMIRDFDKETKGPKK